MEVLGEESIATLVVAAQVLVLAFSQVVCPRRSQSSVRETVIGVRRRQAAFREGLLPNGLGGTGAPFRRGIEEESGQRIGRTTIPVRVCTAKGVVTCTLCSTY